MTEKIGVGELWHGTIAIVHRHFASFAVIAAVMFLLPSLASRLMFPEFLDMSLIGKRPPGIPLGFWPYLLVALLAQAIGVFSIAAVAADPDEGGGQPMGAIIRGVFPAIGKGFLAGLVFMAVYVGFILALAIVGFVVAFVFAAIGKSVAGGNDAGMKSFGIMFAVLLVAVLLPLLMWVAARLAPLTGVYLREPVDVIEGIKRAWGLTKGSAWTVIKIMLIVTVLALCTSAVQLGLAKVGLVGGIGGFLAALIVGALGSLLYMYEAAGIGFLYRRLAAVPDSV